MLVAALVLRSARPALGGGFFLRCAAMALAVCLGGALTQDLADAGVSMGVANLSFFADSSAGNSAISLLYVLPYLFVFGGLLGLLEGLVAAIPLAVAVLGRFGDRI